MSFLEYLQTLIVIPTFWQSVTILWLLGLARCGKYLNATEKWFAEPVGSQFMLWEFIVLAVLQLVINTDLYLDGVLVFIKIQFIKEWWKHEKRAVSTILLGLSILLLATIFSPYIGEWIVG